VVHDVSVFVVEQFFMVVGKTTIMLAQIDLKERDRLRSS
jgi:hypothetical protein